MKLAFATLTALVLASPALALTLEACTRTTHVSHGGEAGHRDLGEGRVAYAEWWSQEGVYLDYIVADCRAGEALRVRAREERISDRTSFDRRDDVEKVLATEFRAAPSLFSFERLALALKPAGQDINIAPMLEEPCACAAAYPQHLGTRTPFKGVTE